MVARLDDNLMGLIASHPSILVGTCDRALVPCVSRGFGARMGEDHASLSVLVSRWPGPQALANIELTRQIAVTFTSPETFESYQVKGRVTDWRECDADDMALCEVFTKTIRDRIAAMNEPPRLVSAIFTPQGLFRVSFEAEAVFLQTPGKNAGQKL